MAESILSDEKASGQQYLDCGTQDCQKNGQFYCNDCHRPLCEQCRDEHLKSPKTKTHAIVFYQNRKQQLPVEKCKLHPIRNIEIFCRECKIPLCSKCSTMKEHHGHKFDDLEEVYTEKYEFQTSELSKIQNNFLPISQAFKKDIEEDVTTIKNIMESIRSSMKAEAESLKNLVDEVTTENIEETYRIEKSLLEMLNLEEATYDDYIAYLLKMTQKLQEYLSKKNQNLLFFETFSIQNIPVTSKPVPPVFIAGQSNKYDIAKLLGRVKVPHKERRKKMILTNSNDGFSPHLKMAKKPLEKSLIKQTLSLSSSVTKVSEYNVPVQEVCHLSVDKSRRIWVSDDLGNLVQTDLYGNCLQNIVTDNEHEGYHTVTEDEGLIYIDIDEKEINRISPDKKISKFIKTGDWTPLSVNSSRINGDILVGMIKDREAKVTRYSKAGKEKQNIQKNNRGQKLYNDPHYITENINGDICTSDYKKRAVVVVDKTGKHRFSYTGQMSEFRPYGICTDVLGHILFCDSSNQSVHLLDQNGEILKYIPVHTQISEVQFDILFDLKLAGPRALCVDDENNLYVGQIGSNTLTVYKYLE